METELCPKHGRGVKARKSSMAKLCPRGKAAAKRKFDVYPSAYANMYASAVCSGKVKPGGKKKPKKSTAKKRTTTKTRRKTTNRGKKR